MSSRIAIVGAGISGLATAYALEKRGFELTVFESESRPGGPVSTFEKDGYRLETGPHTLLVREHSVAELLDELDLEEAAVDAAETADTRYVVRNGRPVPLPMSPVELATTDLLSPLGRLRLLAEPFVPSREDSDVDEPLASFVERRLGEEALDYLVDPFVGGVWAGDPRQLSARHSFPSLVEYERLGGSILVGAIRKKLVERGSNNPSVPRRLISFEQGMQTLVDRLVERIDADIHFDSPVRKLRRDNHDWRVIYQRGKARRGQSFDAVVSTAPPAALGQFEWENIAPPAGAIAELAQMPYAPCCVLGVGFHRDQVTHPLDGFGVLIPRVEDFHILGALFISSMFPDRAPRDHVNIAVFVGGARQPELTDRPDEEVEQLAVHDLRRLLDIDGPPAFCHLTRYERAIPQYEVGHQVFVDHLEVLENQLPQVYFAGNFRDGIGLPDLLEAAKRHADRIADALPSRPPRRN